MNRALHVFLGGALALGVVACQPAEEAEMAGTPPSDATDQVALNTLTEAERADGWQLLFDGQDTDAWRAFRGDDVPARWRIDDAAIYFDPAAEGEGGDIITRDTYENFELAFDWKIGECGNSGVFYHVGAGDEYGSIPQTAPEYQILDNTCHPDAENGPDRHAGANYDLHAPASDVTKPAGEWNTSRIIVDGSHVEHWLNGEQVVTYELWSNAWREDVANSKFADWEDYGTVRDGHIALQDHSDPVWYRNIKIRPIESTDEG